jgi:hypothetical protein
LAVALNVLTFVLKSVGEAGQPARPRVVRVKDFPMVEASRRASLVRVGTWSRRSVRGFGSLYPHGRSLGVVFSGGLFFLVVEFGYPLFRYPTAIFLAKTIMPKT